MVKFVLKSDLDADSNFDQLDPNEKRIVILCPVCDSQLCTQAISQVLADGQETGYCSISSYCKHINQQHIPKTSGKKKRYKLKEAESSTSAGRNKNSKKHGKKSEERGKNSNKPKSFRQSQTEEESEEHSSSDSDDNAEIEKEMNENFQTESDMCIESEDEEDFQPKPKSRKVDSQSYR